MLRLGLFCAGVHGGTFGRAFSVTPRRHVSPIIWMLLQPVLKGTAIITGRASRQWWGSLKGQRWHLFSQFTKRRPLLVFGTIGGSTCALSVYIWTHVQQTPLTGRYRFVLLTERQLLAVVEEEVRATLDTFKTAVLPATHPAYRRVAGVCYKLIQCSADLKLKLLDGKWQIYIVQSDEPNAMAFPNRTIIVTTKLLEVAVNDHQLACVLGHEMSHALLEHAAEQLSQAQLADWFTIVAMAALWMVIPGDGVAIVTNWFMHKTIYLLLHLPYSRRLETEADTVGLELAARACYDIRQAELFWIAMSRLNSVPVATSEHSSDANDDNNVTMVTIPQFLSTHPSNEQRIANMRKRMSALLAIRVKCGCHQLLPSWS